MPLERKPLFRPDILRPKVQSFELPGRVVEHRDVLTRWADLLASAEADNLKEQELLAETGELVADLHSQDD